MEVTCIHSLLHSVSLNTQEVTPVPPQRLAAATAISRGGIDVEGLQEQLAKFQLDSSDVEDQSYQPQALAAALGTQNLDEKEALGLLKKRADLSRCTGDLQRTALHLAAEKSYVNLIEELLKCRVDANRADRAGESPLFALAHSISWSSAPTKQRRASVQRLVEGDADINFANPRGKTPLHVAVSCNDGAVVSALLDEMADVNARDLGGFTALMWAAGRGGVELVQQLLKAKARSELMANRGQTALLFAATNHCHEVTKILDAQAKAEPEQPEEPRRINDMNLPYMGQVASRFAPDLTSNSYGSQSGNQKKELSINRIG
eukprot:symbB.v1.2.004682.t1/scaffold271.1/size245249/5